MPPFVSASASIETTIREVGPWTSQLPGYEALTGCVPLFVDSRIDLMRGAWDISGWRVLELGAFEGGHTYQLSRLGAAVTAIEANKESFLRSLVAKQILGFSATFLLGNFYDYLAEPRDRFDMIFACGVLYHMADPVELLRRCSIHTDRLFLWTMYVPEAIALAWPVARIATRVLGSETYPCYQHVYEDRYDRSYSGIEDTAVRLEMPTIVRALQIFGFTRVEVVQDDAGNGWATLVASRG